jgi:hypothetical protein
MKKFTFGEVQAAGIITINDQQVFIISSSQLLACQQVFVISHGLKVVLNDVTRYVTASCRFYHKPVLADRSRQHSGGKNHNRSRHPPYTIIY